MLTLPMGVFHLFPRCRCGF